MTVVCVLRRAALLMLTLLLASGTSLPTQGQTQPLQAAATPNEPALSLSPAVVIVRGAPGQSLTQSLTLRNGTGTPFNFELVAQDVITRDGTRFFVPAGELSDSIAATAVFTQKNVHVSPGASASVDVTLTLPPASPIRAVVAIFRGVDRIASGTQGVGMTASLGALITFTASENFQLSAAPLEISSPSATQPLLAVQPLTNSGSEPVIPEGVLAVLSDSGKLIGKQPFAPQRLLPGERLPFKAEYPSQLRPGHYRAIASFQFEGRAVSNTAEFTVQ